MKLHRIPSFLLACVVVLLLVAMARATLNIDVPNGPSLGSQNINPFTLATAIANNNQQNFATIVPGAANTQSTCTVVATPLVNIASSVANGSICLPKAIGGQTIKVLNTSGQTVNTFGSNSPFTTGTQDTINGTAGSTAYTGLTTGLSMVCFAPANGVWGCFADS